MFLTSHFTFEELVGSQYAARNGISNIPPSDMIPTLLATAQGMETVRMLLGAPILISSGYRSPELNKALGGAANSQHMLGEAVDFTCPGFGTPEQIVPAIIRAKIPYDQVIIEYDRWVHISFSSRNRQNALVIDKDGTHNYG